MNLLQLRSKKGARHRTKRIGRGNGSGHGTFSTNGCKGQNARSGGKRRPGFEGGQTPFINKMPKLRGFKNSDKIQYSIINLEDLNVFEDGATVDKAALHKKGIITSVKKPLKLLGNGELTKKLIIIADAAAKSAIEKLEKAGIKLELPAPRPKASSSKAEAKKE